MSLKEIDFLSPKITLFYYGSKRHKSLVGSVITLLMVLLSTIYIFYLLLNVINHKLYNFMFYRTYMIEAGQYFFNDKEGIYHYIQLYDIKNKVYGQYNSKYVRIFMSRLYKEYQNNQSSLINNEHWVYDICREGKDNKNINKYIFNEETYFYKGACLRYYYNNEMKKYFPIEDEINFKYPYLIHGSGRNGNLFLETIIEKCDNSSIITDILGKCASEEEINEYLKRYMGVYIQILQKQFITNDYYNPIYEYISGISGSLDYSSIPINNINLSPFLIEFKRGIFLPKSQKIITYIIENNRISTFENRENRKILAIYDYWLQNSCQIIKGGYSTVYDILPSIGGIIQLIYYIFYCINFFYNKYVIIHDCNKSFFKMHNSEDNKHLKSKKTFLRCVKSIRDEVNFRKKNDNYKRHSLFERNKVMKAMQEKHKIDLNKNTKNIKKKFINTEINSNKNILKNINYNNNQINMSNSNDLMISLSKNNIDNNYTNNIRIFNKKNKKNNFIEKKLINENTFKQQYELKSSFFNENDKINNNSIQFSHQLKEFLNYKRKTFKIEPLNQKIMNKYLTFYNYLLSFTGNSYRKRGFLVLNKFRQKLLGEEHLFRTNIFLYHLEKYFKIKENEKIDIYELYENL